MSEVENFHGRKLSRPTQRPPFGCRVAKRQSSGFRKAKANGAVWLWTGFDNRDDNRDDNSFDDSFDNRFDNRDDNRDDNMAPSAGHTRNPIVLEVLHRVRTNQLHHPGTHHLRQVALRAFLGHQ
jgi:hypothetical protein